MSFTRVTLKNRHAIWALAIAAAVFGTLAYFAMPVQLFPDTAPPLVNVITLWPGASAEDIAEDLSRPLEEEFAALESIVRVESTSQDNLSVVSIEFGYERQVELAAVDVQNAISRIRGDLPSEIREPQVLQFSTNDRPVITVGVRASSLSEARRLAEDELAAQLQRVPGVAAVDVFGGAREAVIVELDPLQLEARQIPLSRVSVAIRAFNVAMPAGELRLQRSRSSLRIVARADSPEEISRIPVATEGGRRVLISDLGTVRRATLDDDSAFAINGEWSIAMQVFKTSEANTVAVVDAVTEEVRRINASHEGLTLTIGEESGSFAETSIDNLLGNVWQALFMASVIIFLFLGNVRTSIVVVLSMPLSYGITFALMNLAGVEFNMVTLSAVILAVGMVVDASVVVIENISRRHTSDGGSIEEAAIAGTDEVQLPVIAGVATTVVVLVPLLFLEGFVGKTFGPLALTLLLAFTSSVVVALVLLPTLSLWTGGGSRLDRYTKILTSPFNRVVDFVSNGYVGTLKLALRHRIVTLLVALGALVFGAALIAHQGMEVLPRMDSGAFSVALETPPGTSLEETRATVATISSLIEDHPEVVMVQAQAGFEAGMRSMSGTGVQGPTQGFLAVTLSDRTEREATIWEVEQRVREEILAVPGVQAFTVREAGATANATTSAPILILLSGPDSLILDRLGDEVRDRLGSIPNVVDPVRSWRIDQPRDEVFINDLKALQLGLSPARVGAELMAGSTGTEAGGLDEEDGSTTPIVVRYQQAESHSPSDLLRFPVQLPTGDMVTLRTIAQVRPTVEQGLITRQNFTPTLEVSAFTSGRALSFVITDVERSIEDLTLPQGYTALVTGEKSDLDNARSQIFNALIISVLAVYLVLVAQLRSFLHPVTIMMSVPLSLSGVGIALWIAGKPVSMPVMVGLILLIGIVVNNAIILVDFIRQRREEGGSRAEAVIEAVSSRFRPVMMTSLSTIIGMIPLAAEWALGAERFSPLAIAVIGGMSAATLLTLIVIPTLYDLLDDVSLKLRKLVVR